MSLYKITHQSSEKIEFTFRKGFIKIIGWALIIFSMPFLLAALFNGGIDYQFMTFGGMFLFFCSMGLLLIRTNLYYPKKICFNNVAGYVEMIGVKVDEKFFLPYDQIESIEKVTKQGRQRNFQTFFYLLKKDGGVIEFFAMDASEKADRKFEEIKSLIDLRKNGSPERQNIHPLKDLYISKEGQKGKIVWKPRKADPSFYLIPLVLLGFTMMLYGAASESNPVGFYFGLAVVTGMFLIFLRFMLVAFFKRTEIELDNSSGIIQFRSFIFNKVTAEFTLMKEEEAVVFFPFFISRSNTYLYVLNKEQKSKFYTIYTTAVNISNVFQIMNEAKSFFKMEVYNLTFDKAFYFEKALEDSLKSVNTERVIL